MQHSRIDSLIATLADEQHGVVARSQLLAAGVGREAIAVRLRGNRLFPRHAGVYSVGRRGVSTRGSWMAAVLASGPGAVLSHDSAAALWGIGGRSGGWPHVVTTRSSRAKGIRRHRLRLSSDETAVRERIPVTDVGRTIFDLASELSVESLVRLIREAEVAGLTMRVSLPALLERHRGERGCRALGLALGATGALTPATGSELEERFRRFVRAAGLPRPQHNVRLRCGAREFEVDCAWPSAGLIVELDGRRVHATGAAFETDREKDRHLQAEGWTVVRVTWRQLQSEASALRRDLLRLLGRPAYKRP